MMRQPGSASTRSTALALTACAVILACIPQARSAEPSVNLVVCAPGFPGNTEAAKPTMDAFAAGVASASGWESGRLRAEYHQTLEGGLSALAREDSALTLVPLPFYLKFRDELGLEPLLQVKPVFGETERFTLVARREAIQGPATLAGWQIHGLVGYAPNFVERVLLADWGPLPDSAEVIFTSRIVSSMRKAVAGENVAVLLDSAQFAALPGLPFAAELEPVTQSTPLLASVLCSVGGRLSDASAEQLIPAFRGLEASADGRTILESIRMQGFVPADLAALRRHETAFATAFPARSEP